MRGAGAEIRNTQEQVSSAIHKRLIKSAKLSSMILVSLLFTWNSRYSIGLWYQFPPLS